MYTPINYVPQEQQHWILLLLMLFTLKVQLFVMWLNKQTYKNEKKNNDYKPGHCIAEHFIKVTVMR